MNNTFIFIRHAKTKVDKKTPIENWILTEDGTNSAIELGNSGNFDDADVLISSNEDKSYLTLKPLAEKLGKQIIKIPELGEIKRPNSEKLTLEEYNDLKTKIFADLNFTSHDWESSNQALIRFKEATEKIDQQYSDKKILICAHGTVMTLYFAYLQGKMNDLFSRWHSLEFGSYGIVSKGKVIKDIV